MSTNWSSGILYGITALLTGFAAFAMMMQTVNGGPWSWWGPIMLGSAILLMVAALRALAPRLAVIWWAVIAAATPLSICTAFGTWPLRCWLFAAILGLSAWVIITADKAIKHGDIAALLVSLLLVASWTAITVNTVHASLSTNAANTSVVALAMLLLFWALTIGVLLRAGTTVFRGRE
jgi:hypothetical protein